MYRKVLKPGVMAYPEADAGELSQALGKLGLHSEFQTSLIYGVRP